MPSFKRSRYAAVNERRRKREWNARSTGQLGRRRAERLNDLNASGDRLTNPRGKRRTHGFVNTGYLAALMADREAILAEARADSLRARGETGPAQVPVAEAHHPDGAFKAEAHVRTLTLGPAMREIPLRSEDRIEQTEDGRWRVGDRTFRYKSEAEAALGTTTPL